MESVWKGGNLSGSRHFGGGQLLHGHVYSWELHLCLLHRWRRVRENRARGRLISPRKYLENKDNILYTAWWPCSGGGWVLDLFRHASLLQAPNRCWRRYTNRTFFASCLPG